MLKVGNWSDVRAFVVRDQTEGRKWQVRAYPILEYPMLGGLSEEALTFVQRSQIVAGSWNPSAKYSGPLEACRLLKRIPPLRYPQDLRAIAAVLTLMSDHVARFDWPARVPHVRRDPVALVFERFAEPGLRLEDVARSVGLSKWHCSRRIRESTRLRWPELVGGLRIYRAIQLLVASDFSIKEISYKVGCRDTGELDRLFARWLRKSPRAFLKALSEHEPS